jgi:hypothetical protein
MALINKYERCRGLTLFKWGRKRMELWYIPPGYKIIEHTHPDENVELMFIFGKTRFFRRDIYTGKIDYVITNWKYFAKRFTVGCFHSHWFETTSWPLVFINFQTFLWGTKPRSAAKDFLIYNKFTNN